MIDRVKAQLAQLRHGPAAPTSSIRVIRDQSRFIKASIDAVRKHLLLGAVLVALTVLLFMRDWRSTIIAALAIPTSIIATFTFMRYIGFTLNNITMLGLVLAVGIVIDDAVVVLENIFRHIEEEGEPPMEAASRGTAEIALAVMATTLSLVVIFLPGRLHGGPRRPLLPQLRHHGRGRDHGVAARLVHADADAVRALPAAPPGEAGARAAGSTGALDRGYGAAPRAGRCATAG